MIRQITYMLENILNTFDEVLEAALVCETRENFEQVMKSRRCQRKRQNGRRKRTSTGIGSLISPNTEPVR